MEIPLLADHPEAVDLVARWYFDQWAHESPSVTLERVKYEVATSANRVSPPLLVLARKDETVIGAAALKIREMEICPEKEFWLGGVYVSETERRKGVASALVEAVLSQAREFGIERLFLQTERLDGGLYRQHGFEAIEEIEYKGSRVLIMETQTGA